MDAITPKTWTAERVDLLRSLFAEGMSFARIAGVIGWPVTKNSALTKAKTLGLQRSFHHDRYGNKVSTNKRGRSPRNNAAPYQVKARKERASAPEPLDPEPLPAPDEADLQIPLGQRCSLMDLTSETCRFPIGDPGHPDFFFCGGKPVSGLPYCGYHSRVAYRPPQGRINLWHR